MRVISGYLKGKKLFSVKGQTLRPTSDRVKEAIFDILQDQIQGRKVLDLFAGTGALGIEALSRGASCSVFVEQNRRSLEALRKNIGECKLSEKVEVIAREAKAGIKILEGRGKSFEVIFLDPPYGQGLARQTLKTLSQSSIVAPTTLVVAEHSLSEDLDSIPSWQRIDGRKYGRTRVSFFRPEKESSGPYPEN